MSLLATKRRRDMARQRWQFVAVFITMALGVMLFALSRDAYRNLESSYEGTYERLDFADLTVVGADAEFADTARGLHGVAGVVERRQGDLAMRVSSHVFEGRVVGMPADEQPAINRLDVIAGTYLSEDVPLGVVAETHLARQFGLGVGDTIEILAGDSVVEAEIVGVAVSPEYLWPARSRQEVFPPPGSFGVVFAAGSLVERLPSNVVVHEVLVRYSEGVDRAEVEATVTAAALDAGAGDLVPRAQQASNQTLQLDVKGFEQLAVAFPAMFLLAAGLAAFILLNRMVLQQRPLIGTLRASGVGRRQLGRHFLGYGVILGTGAALVGGAVGMALGWVATGLYTEALGIPDTVRQLHPTTPILALAFGIGTGPVAAWVPARSAMGVAPAEAMRGSAPTTGGGPSPIERLVPRSSRLPVRWLMVIRGLGRNVRRSLSTVVGVVLALILVMVSWGMIDSVRILLDKQFHEVSLSDVTVVDDRRIDDGFVDRVAGIAGVDAAEAVTRVQATLRTDGGTYATELAAFEPNTVMHGFPEGLGDGLTLGRATRHLLGVGVGDRVTVGLPGFDTSFTATVDGFVDEPLGTFAYTTREALAAAVGDPPGPAESGARVVPVLEDPSVTTVAVRALDGTDRGVLIERLEALGPVVATIDERALEDVVNDYLAFFYVFVGVMLIFGGIMALALIFNTTLVNVAERSGEYATMLANGLSLSRIARLIAAENLVLTAFGVVPGVVLGWLAGVWFMAQYSSDLFTLTFEMRPLSVVACVAVLFVVAMASLVPALRTIRRLDVGRVVRQQVM